MDNRAERRRLLYGAARALERGEFLGRDEASAVARALHTLLQAEFHGLDVDGFLADKNHENLRVIAHLARVVRFGRRVAKPSAAIVQAKGNRSRLTVPLVEFFVATGESVHDAARQTAAILGRNDAESIRHTYLHARRRKRR